MLNKLLEAQVAYASVVAMAVNRSNLYLSLSLSFLSSFPSLFPFSLAGFSFASLCSSFLRPLDAVYRTHQVKILFESELNCQVKAK